MQKQDLTWEQRKLSGILCEKNERTSDFMSFPLYSLTIENGITPKTDRYERSSLVTKTEDLFKVVNQNEFVTNPMNLRFGALGYNKMRIVSVFLVIMMFFQLITISVVRFGIRILKPCLL